MAVELRDLRAKVTPLTDVALEAEARAFGLEKSELVRDILEAWAGKKVHAARILTGALKREGMNGELEGACK
jgi:hypothetical protein